MFGIPNNAREMPVNEKRNEYMVYIVLSIFVIISISLLFLFVKADRPDKTLPVYIFVSESCGHCRTLLSKLYLLGGRKDYISIFNIQQYPEFISQYTITQVPTIICKNTGEIFEGMEETWEDVIKNELTVFIDECTEKT